MTDQRGTGFPRGFNGQADIGAFEDSVPIELSVANASIIEGSGGGTTLLNIPVSVNSTTGIASSVMLDVTAGSATAGTDYTNPGTVTVNFAQGDPLSQNVAITVTADDIVEVDETFTVNLFSPAGGSITTSNATGTINNDDTGTITLAPITSSANEGDSGTTPLIFEVSVDNPVSGGFSIAYTSDDGTATVADNDYTDNDASLSFADLDNSSQTITVLAIGDTVVEGDETFTVALGAISGLAAGIDPNDVGVGMASTTSLTGTILGDDGNQAVTLSATKTVEGEPIVGGLITYLITLTNLGPGTQNDNPGAELTDILPPSLSLLSATADAGAVVANLASNTVTWNGSLAANASVNLTIKAGILAAAEGTTIAN